MNLEGGQAVGISGKDANMIRVRKLLHRSQADPEKEIDIGYVGEIESVDPSVLMTLEDGGFIPVISPLGMGSDGHAYNINADTVAGEIARATKAERLILLTDTPGVLEDINDPTSIQSSLSASNAKNLIASGMAGGGMIPKLKACLRGLGGGVKKAHIIDGRVAHSVLLELFTDTGVGTQVFPDP